MTCESSKPLKPLFQMFLIVLLLAGLHPVAVAQGVSISAELSASTITRDESVTLSITAIGIDAELDASSLDADFDVVGRSSSRQISTVIGADNRAVNTSVVKWTLDLLPRGQGVFTVPAVKVGDYETQLLTLTVNEVPKGAKRDVFLEASVDTTTPWVQSQVLMTLKVFQAIEIIDGGLDIPAADDLVVERLGDDTRERVIRDGREYSVTERRFAMFPQKSGVITIDPVTLSVTIPAQPDRVRGFFSPTRKLTRRSDRITLNVQARPPSGASWWLPATRLTLENQWQGDPLTAQVDQPLTRTLIMRAEGVLSSQLPEVTMPAIDGLSLYAEDPSLGMTASASGVVAEQRINWALIPQRSGTLTLPAIKLEWFNTLTGKNETVELAEQVITVQAPSVDSTSSPMAPGSDIAQSSSANSDTNDNVAALTDRTDLSPTDLSVGSTDNRIATGPLSPQGAALAEGLQASVERWQYLAMAAVALWALTLLGWLVTHRRSLSIGKGSDTTRRANSGDGAVNNQTDTLYQQLVPMSQLKKACKQGDLLSIKRALLDWATRQWPDDTFNTLDKLLSVLPQGEAREKLARMQTALYSKQGYSVMMPALAADLERLPADLKAALQQVNTVAAANRKSGAKASDPSRLPSL